ncbi:MAG TPA: GSU2403 family nucleotidyltransferase fold protein [Polyangiaceae bacterium]
MSLFTRHPLVLQTAFSDLKRRAQEQPFLLTGTPGSVGTREVSGRPFYYRQFYDAQGKKAAEYIGPVGAKQAEERAEAIRGAIALTRALVKEVRLLVQTGYVRADPRTGAILGALANHALFRGGAVLVGSRAYGTLLNELGVRAAAFSTEDVDIARGRPLEIALEADVDFEKILAASTVPLLPVPGFDRKAPATSYKSAGRDRLRVDLLVPATGTEVSTRPVPELRAHAQAMPYLRQLLARPLDTVVLGREGVVPVRVPRPEAFAWHKVLLSQLRGATSDKRGKDSAQAAVILAVLSEDAPDALEVAFAELPRGTKSKTRSAAKPVIELLRRAGYERAVQVVGETTAGNRNAR